MPELPEVQIVVEELRSSVLGQKIVDVAVTVPKVIKNASVRAFKSYLVGETFRRVDRVGKYIVFHLSNRKVLVSHLRMEGKYFFEAKTDPYDRRHVLVRFVFADAELRYHDTRRFGTFYVYGESDYMEAKELSKLALDPLSEKFGASYLSARLSKTRRAIKTALLDQTVVAGIGNIYADEILFACGIHPKTPAAALTMGHMRAIAKNARSILKDSIRHKGTTIASYLFKKDHAGSFQNKLKVHTKAKRPCPGCATAIAKIKVNGRGTYFCPNCQREPRC